MRQCFRLFFYDTGRGFHGDCAGYDKINFAYTRGRQYFECVFQYIPKLSRITYQRTNSKKENDGTGVMNLARSQWRGEIYAPDPISLVYGRRK